MPFMVVQRNIMVIQPIFLLPERYAYYTSHVLYAPVLTMGKVVDYDRPFKVVVDMEESTAVEG